jgi:hypothetical protein
MYICGFVQVMVPMVICRMKSQLKRRHCTLLEILKCEGVLRVLYVPKNAVGGVANLLKIIGSLQASSTTYMQKDVVGLDVL